jgi:hypothetical protein
MTNDFSLSVKKNIFATHQNWPRLRHGQFPPEKDTHTPVPPLSNCQRILGQTTTEDQLGNLFIEAGNSDLNCVMNIAEVYGFSGGRVLEWGVGCGRISRHLCRKLRPGFVGVDVDTVNIGWCQHNLPWGHYLTVSPHGRIPLRDKSVDLIYGWSVMTHLCEADQNWWLAELHRVCRGLVILSVHGFLHAARYAEWWNDISQATSWIQSGFRNSELPNPDISDVVGDDYYRDVAHTPAYIFDEWTKAIDVLDIIPGGFGESHDAVVCRAR